MHSSRASAEILTKGQSTNLYKSWVLGEQVLGQRVGAMSSDMLEVLDANIVIIPEVPLTLSANPLLLFEKSDLASLMHKPLTVGQGLNLDVTLGAATGSLQIESMRSQKTISLSPLRIEVHDRSGNADLEKAKIPDTIVALASAFHIERINAVGANWEVVFKSPGEISASAAIAKRLLQQDTSFLPQNIRPIGGAVRMFLSDDAGVLYTLVIEPRGLNALTDDLWMSCNAHVTISENLSIELLKEIFQQSYNLLLKVKESLFPAPKLGSE